MKKEKRVEGGDLETTDIPHQEQTTGKEAKRNRSGDQEGRGGEVEKYSRKQH